MKKRLILPILGVTKTVAVCLLVVLAFIGVVFSLNQIKRAQLAQQDRIEIIVNPLLETNGKPIGVSLVCATTPTPGRPSIDFICTIKNNTNSKLSAFHFIYSITFDIDGVEKKISSSRYTFNVLHPELDSKDKLIHPGSENKFSITPPLSGNKEKEFIYKKLEIGLDYVDFEDNVSKGPNKKAGDRISDIRKGAAAYHDWLQRGNFRKLKSKAEKEEFLRKPLPKELKFQEKGKNKGVKGYIAKLRNDIRKGVKE